MDCKILKKDFLKRSAKGKGKVEAVINTDKQFGITYFLEKEEITFEVWGREYELTDALELYLELHNSAD
jgi:hypothetical protein